MNRKALFLLIFCTWLLLLFPIGEKNRFWLGLLQMPPCYLKIRTGIPCPLCNGTTAIRLLWKGKFISALNQNPLAVFLYIVVATISLIALIGIISTKTRMFSRKLLQNTRFLKIVLLVLIILFSFNWLWLKIQNF